MRPRTRSGSGLALALCAGFATLSACNNGPVSVRVVRTGAIISRIDEVSVRVAITWEPPDEPAPTQAAIGDSPTGRVALDPNASTVVFETELRNMPPGWFRPRTNGEPGFEILITSFIHGEVKPCWAPWPNQNGGVVPVHPPAPGQTPTPRPTPRPTATPVPGGSTPVPTPQPTPTPACSIDIRLQDFPQQILPQGTAPTISWTATNATLCSVRSERGGWQGLDLQPDQFGQFTWTYPTPPLYVTQEVEIICSGVCGNQRINPQIFIAP